METAVKKERVNPVTWAEYKTWPEYPRYEIIDGTPYAMSSPGIAHQAISMELSRQLANFLRGKPYKAFAAPFDVRLFPKEDDSDTRIVQPDLLVVCDESKLSSGTCKGPPDFIIEILSPSNSPSGQLIKFNYYLSSGVKEYWVVDPEEKYVQVHILSEDRYISTGRRKPGKVPVSALPGLEVDFTGVWPAA